jgi:hypothetical protein
VRVAELLVFQGELVDGADKGGDVGAELGEFLVLVGDGLPEPGDGGAEPGPSPRSRRAVASLTTGVPESSSKKSGRRCRTGPVVFVAGVRPPARGGTKVKEPRS